MLKSSKIKIIFAEVISLKKYFLLLVLFSLPHLAHAEIIAPSAISTAYSSGNDHYVRGENHIVNVGNTVIAIVSDGGSERLFRSTNRSSWAEILYTASAHNSSLLSGPENYVYYFYMDSANDRIRMRKFLANAQTIPDAVNIHLHADVSLTSTGVYRSVSSTIDKEGRIFVFVHYGSPDSIYCLVSNDYGSTWNSYLVSSATASAFYGTAPTTLSDRTLVLAYDVWGTDSNVWFTKSEDHGQTWSSPVLVASDMGNPAILAMPDDTLFVFGQGGGTSGTRGVIFNKSENKGETWGSTILVEATCGYGDPSAALGSDGSKIWLDFRSSLGTGITSGTCGDMSRQVLAYSDNEGISWNAVWRYYEAERTGVHGHIAYQPYYNYGGPIEWIWLQYTDSETYRRTFYSYSSSDNKYYSAGEGTPEDTMSPGAPSGLSVS